MPVTETEPVVSPSTPAPAPKPKPESKKFPPPKPVYHPVRKAIHAICVVIFVILPFFNVMRFDIPRQRFYIIGQELWINEFGIIFFSLMFLMFLIAGTSMIYGRVYCGYMCPQMIFSEAATEFELAIKRWTNKKFPKLDAKKRNWFNTGVFYTAVGVASVFLSFVFISYFVEPRDLIQRLLAFDLKTAAGISGAATTLITFIDFMYVRQRFCTTICPYGYLQGILSDKNTLLVHYRDDQKQCIDCKKCVKICPMGIDIRKSPDQIECVHCGECIDACADVLGRKGNPGLIHYAWGEKGELFTEKNAPWYRRLGLLDAKRAVVMLVLVFYASGLWVALAMRRTVLVHILPVRATLYRVENGKVFNTFRLTVANRGTRDETFTLQVKGLDKAQLVMKSNPLQIKAGEVRHEEIELMVDPADIPAGVNHFQFVSRTAPDPTEDSIPMTFITPMERKK